MAGLSKYLREDTSGLGTKVPVEAPPKEDNTQVAGFGGIFSPNANLKKLSQAEKLVAAGKGPAEVWDKTGWYMGPDGKWRFEFSDKALTFKRQLKEGDEGPMKDFVEHPEGYKAYPDLKDSRFIVRDLGSKTLGSYGRPFQTDPESFSLAPRPGVKSTLVHEIQHGLQEREGFALGATTLGLRPGTPQWDLYQQILKNMRAKPDMAKFAAEHPDWSPEDIETVHGQLMKTYNSYKRSGIPPEYDRMAQDTAVEQGYRKAGGEVESRNVQHRLKMPDEDLKYIDPSYTQDVPSSEQLIKIRDPKDVYAGGVSDGGLLGRGPSQEEQDTKSKDYARNIGPDFSAGGLLPFGSLPETGSVDRNWPTDKRGVQKKLGKFAAGLVPQTKRIGENIDSFIVEPGRNVSELGAYMQGQRPNMQPEELVDRTNRMNLDFMGLGPMTRMAAPGVAAVVEAAKPALVESSKSGKPAAKGEFMSFKHGPASLGGRSYDAALDPPPVAQRGFEEDYPNANYTQGLSPGDPLTRNLKGRKLEAQYVAGRQTYGGPDIGLTEAEIDDVIKQILGPNGVEYLSKNNPEFPANAHAFFDPATNKMGITEQFDPSKYQGPSSPRHRFYKTHEIGHGIGHNVGLPIYQRDLPGMKGVPLDKTMRQEMTTVYGDTNEPDLRMLREGGGQGPPPSQQGNYTPHHAGYHGMEEADAEYVAEAYRLMLRDPNYMKTMAPETVDKLRLAVDRNPRIRRIIQFNAGGFPVPVAGAAGMLGALDAQDPTQQGQDQFQPVPPKGLLGGEEDNIQWDFNPDNYRG